jgi:hypothetical protein
VVLEAVMQLADEFAGYAPKSGFVAVTGGAAGVVVGTGAHEELSAVKPHQRAAS